MYNYIKNGKIFESKEPLFYYGWTVDGGSTVLGDFYTEKEFKTHCANHKNVSVFQKDVLPYFNSEIYVVENYNHSKTDKYVYRVFKSLSQAVKYVELDIFYLLTVIYGVQNAATEISLTENFYDIINKSFPVRVFVNDDRIEFWMVKENGSLDYPRNIIRVNSKFFDKSVDTLEEEYTKRYGYGSN